MISQTILRSTLRRLRHPAAWGAIVGFELVWLMARRFSGVQWAAMGSWEGYVPALFMLGHLIFAPSPWQWSGDDRPLATLWRGALQALCLNAAWVGILLWGLQGVVRPPHPSLPTVSAAGSPQPPPPPPGLRQEMKLLFLNLPFALVIGWFLAGKERAESREEELAGQERQARALALQAQLHPHALYNVLAGITELIHEDPDAAEKAVVGLVDLLRMLTRQGHAPSLPLAQERALLRRYLAIESIRLGDRLKVQWDWPDWADALDLPPLLLQPLVENAIKHGITPCPEGGELWISVRRQDQALLLQVANTGADFDPAASAGTGLSNLKARLALMPHLAATLVIRKEADRTLAEVRMGTTLA